MVVGLGVLLLHEVYVVGTHEFDAVLPCQLYQHLVGLLLQGEGVAVGAYHRVAHLMALQLQVVVVAKHAVIPLHGLTCSGHVAIQYLLGHLAGNAGRAHDESLVIALQVFAVGTRTHVVAVHPRAAYQLDQVLVARVVLGQHDEVVAALVFLAAAQRLRAVARHVHLAAEDGLEGLQTLLLASFVHAHHDVVKLLDAEHVAVVGDGHAAHAVLQRLIH